VRKSQSPCTRLDASFFSIAEEGEDLLAYAKRLLEQLDWMIDEQQKKCAALRKVIEVAFEPALSAVALTGAGFLGGLNRLGWTRLYNVLA